MRPRRARIDIHRLRDESLTMNPLVKLQTDFNASSAAAWESYESQRQKVTELLTGDGLAPAESLCVLGAGNCNDLDLPALRGAYREVHLVDLDEEALDHGVARQGLANHAGLIRHGSIDVTGMLERMAKWSPDSAISDEDLAACRDAPALQASRLPAPFDTVASTCLLSQLLLGVADRLGEKHPRFLDVLQAIRWGHLRLLLDLLAPGGRGVLVTDLVSSDTCAELRTVPDVELPPLLNQLIEARNFYHGINPAVLYSLLANDSLLSPQIVDLAASQPWRWDMGARIYAVCAFRFRKI
jgi:hypothetical protein